VIIKLQIIFLSLGRSYH